MKIPSWTEKAGLFLFSFFLTTFILFSFLECFPALPRLLKLDKVHYYSLKGRYTPDADLVFRNQPNLRYEGFFTGDIQGLSEKMTPRPYAASFDEEGFRNTGKPAQTDIVVLGDSFMQFGLTEADSFASRLEKASGLSTANYGTEWYGPQQYVEVFKKFALKRAPRYALFCFFEGNDLRDARQYLQWKNGKNYYHFNLTSKNFIQRYFIALKETAVYFLKRFLKQWDPRKALITLNGKTIETVFVYGIDPNSAEELLSSPEGKALSNALAEFKEISSARKILPLVLFIPSTAHIYMPYAREEKKIPGQKPYEEQLALRGNTEEAVRKASLAAGLEFLSFVPAFEKAAREGKMLYYPADTHWNEEGRQIAAELTKEKLTALITAQMSNAASV